MRSRFFSRSFGWLLPLVMVPCSFAGQESASQKLVLILHVKHGGAASVAFSPKGDVLAVSRADGDVSLLDTLMLRQKSRLRTGQVVSANGAHIPLRPAVSFAPDGRSLAAGTADGQILLFDIARRTVARALSCRDAVTRKEMDFDERDVRAREVSWLGFSRDGSRLSALYVEYAPARDAYGDAPGRLKVDIYQKQAGLLWDVRSGTLLRKDLSASLFALSPDGRTLVRSGQGGAMLTDMEHDRQIASLPDREGGSSRYDYQLAAFTPDGKLAIVAGNGALARPEVGRSVMARGRIWVVDVRSGKTLHRSDRSHFVTAVACSRNAVALGGLDGHIEILDVESGRVVAENAGRPGRINGLAFEPSGERLVAATGTGLYLYKFNKP